MKTRRKEGDRFESYSHQTGRAGAERFGWSLVVATAGTVLLGAVALLVGANAVGLVALAAIGMCGWTLVIAEMACRHRIGLPPEHMLDEPWGGARWREFSD